MVNALAREGKRHFPGISVPRPTFESRVQAALETQASLQNSQSSSQRPDLATGSEDANMLEKVGIKHPADLYLAAGCLAKLPAALAHFELTCMSPLPKYLLRLSPSEDFADEVTQQVRAAALVDNAKTPPKLTQYAGRGPLPGWIRVVAMRKGLDLVRQRADATAPDGGPAGGQDLADVAMGPEEVSAKNANQAVFQQALREALMTLTPRQRNVLRLRFVDNWSPDDIAESYNVHRATVARWLTSARADVRNHMANALQDRMGFERSEFDSVARMVESRLHVSLSRL